MKKSAVSVFLLAAMLLTLTVSCGNENDAGSGTTQASDRTDTTAPIEESPFVADDLPSDLDLGGAEVKSLKINFQTNSFVPFTTLGREF